MRKSIAKIVITSLVVILAAVITIFGMQLSLFGWNVSYPSVVDKTQGIKHGLELAGGTVVTFEVSAEDVTAEQMENVKAIVRTRLRSLGYSEASIYRLGKSKVRVEIPASLNAKALADLLGQTAEFTIEDAAGNVLVTSSDVLGAAPQYDEQKASSGQGYYVTVQLQNSSSSKFAEATKAIAEGDPSSNYIVIKLDNQVISTAGIQNAISTGAFNITGGFTSLEQTQQTAALINSGKLPFDVKMVEFRSLDATSAQTIQAVLWALVIAIVLIMLLLCIVYRLPGVMVSVGLIAYFAVYAFILSIFRTTLGMLGVIGVLGSVILTVGVSVAVLAGMRDEFIAKKPIRAVVLIGFDKAYKWFLDTSVIVLIGAVLFYCFAIAPLQNFAVAIIIGVLVSLITTLAITKFLLLAIAELDLKDTKVYSAAGGRN